MPSMIGASVGLSAKYCATPFGSALRCGTMDPGTAAMARSSSSTSAVRMLVSWRQHHRSQPIGPRAGWTMSSPPAGGGAESAWSAGRSGSPTSDAPSPESSEREGDTAHHPLQLGHRGAPHAGDHEHAEHDQQDAADDVDRADVPPQEGDGAGRPPESERDEDERDAEPQRVREPEQGGTGGVAEVPRDRDDGREGRADAGC